MCIGAVASGRPQWQSHARVDALLACLTAFAGGGVGFVTTWQSGQAVITASTRPSLLGRIWKVGLAEMNRFRRSFAVESPGSTCGFLASSEPLFQASPYLASAPVDQSADSLVTLTFVDDRPGRLNDRVELEGIRRFAELLGQLMEECGGSGVSPSGVVSEPASRYEGSRGENEAILADFLFSTLLDRPALKRRGEIAWHVCRTWRAPIKEHQLKALRLLKASPTQSFIDRVAGDLHLSAERLFGVSMLGEVTAVPCGHSGPGCFAQRVAQALARRLDRPFIELFAPLAVTGSSHPIKNKRRPRMQLLAEPKGPLLLIDDVATSGDHMSEAAGLLRGRGASTLSLAWIGS
jgi:hypothetical protein